MESLMMISSALFRINNDITEYTPTDEIAENFKKELESPESIAKSHNMVRALLSPHRFL